MNIAALQHQFKVFNDKLNAFASMLSNPDANANGHAEEVMGNVIFEGVILLGNMAMSITASLDSIERHLENLSQNKH